MTPPSDDAWHPARDIGARFMSKFRELREVHETREADERAAAGVVPEVERWRERAGWKLAGLGVPDDCAEALEGAAQDTEPMRQAATWWQGESRVLLLLGNVGTGKTTAGAWCLREALTADMLAARPSGYDSRKREPVAFVLGSTLARLSLYGREAGEEIERMCLVGLLVLDDFGREKLSEPAAALVDEMLTRRLGSRRCRTVLTSNLGKRELAERLGPRIADRLRQHATVAVSVGDSLRKRPAGPVASIAGGGKARGAGG